jgi:hypothetical protein
MQKDGRDPGSLKYYASIDKGPSSNLGVNKVIDRHPDAGAVTVVEG